MCVCVLQALVVIVVVYFKFQLSWISCVEGVRFVSYSRLIGYYVSLEKAPLQGDSDRWMKSSHNLYAFDESQM